ncbi:MAG TPA: DUF1573 domain-containing protein [Verrucomicrobiae bacterium]|jgi:hypothetical protein|nr:DUF1573 domain-containing protein [Verrucomicrobiae bacterium]
MKQIFTAGAFFSLLCAAVAQPALPPTPEAGPKIIFDSQNYEFGKVTQGAFIRHDFVVSNGGNATLNITDVHPGCGCTTAGTWPHELAPGQSGIIPIQINSQNLSGKIRKSVTVSSNDKRNPTMLELGGEVIKPVDITPAYAMFRLTTGETNVAPSTIRILNRTENPIQITKVFSDTTAFSVSEPKMLTDGKEYEITVTAVPPVSHGTNGVISVATSWSNYVMRIPAYLTVQPAIMVQPRTITVPAEVDRPMQFTVTLYSSRPNDVFSDPKASDDRIGVTLGNSMPGRAVYVLKVTIPAGYKTTPGHPATVSVKTTDPQQSLEVIPIQQAVSLSTIPSNDAMVRSRQAMPAVSSSGAH